MFQTKRPTVSAAEEILNGYFPVLDHGFVSLIDYMGGDADIERAARVSYGAGTRKVSQTRGLIRYLRRHRHTTPTEMVELKFHCAMPMFVARQWIRHRTASVNEMSARYSLMPLLFYTPKEEDFKPQSKKNNQGRDVEMSREAYEEAVRRWEDLRARAGDTYGWLLEEEVAREIARIDLPVSVYTQWYWKIDLHNLLHFLGLRCHKHAQHEIRQFANVMAAMVRRVSPLTYEAWLDYDLLGAPVSRMERAVFSKLLHFDEEGILVAGGELSTEELKSNGLSDREIAELKEKIKVPIDPNFELDLSTMRSAEEVGKEMSEAVPSLNLS